MPKYLRPLLIGLLFMAACQTTPEDGQQKQNSMKGDRNVELGNFSISLNVKDIAASRTFYEKLGFVQTNGVQADNWLVMQSGTTTIGLFQGMLTSNILTFNPGWNHKKETLDRFTDVRDLQSKFKKAGLTLVTEADGNSTGPAHMILTDPDGNTIMFDQHVDKPSTP